MKIQRTVYTEDRKQLQPHGLMCRENHVMTKLPIQDRVDLGFICDVCMAKIPTSPAYRCNHCAYYVCSSCADQAQQLHAEPLVMDVLGMNRCARWVSNLKKKQGKWWGIEAVNHFRRQLGREKLFISYGLQCQQLAPEVITWPQL